MMVSTRFGRPLSLAVMLVAATACATGPEEAAEDATEVGDDETAVTSSNETASAGTDGLVALPIREGPREETTNDVPHIQTSAEPVPAVDAELRRRAFSLPGVEERESRSSLPGARSLWLADDIDLARPEVLQSGREFGHFHPNGSLHLWLPVDRAVEVAETKWGELHPWVGRDDFWDGLVMVYVPETMDEADITMRLIVDAYNNVTGSEVDPAAFP